MTTLLDRFLDKRREKARSDTKWLGLMIILSLIMFAIDVTVDIFLPFNNMWFNLMRTGLVLVSAYPFFCFGYCIVMRQHDANIRKSREKGEDYIDYRLRYSPSMRLRQSAILGAVLAVLAIITSYSVMYTFIGSVIMAVIIGIAGYCRYTPDEKIIQQYNDENNGDYLPDPRDVMEYIDNADRELEKQARAELRREEIKRRKNKLADDEDDELADDYEESSEDEDYSDDDYRDVDSDEYEESKPHSFKEYRERMEGASLSRKLR